MPVSSITLSLFRFLLPPAVLSLLWLYLYPTINGCHFPEAVPAQGACLTPGAQQPTVRGELAPFRLLVLADPQLEGDTSLPNPNAPQFPSLVDWADVLHEHGPSIALGEAWPTVRSVVTDELPAVLQSYRKRLDLFGNDYYLAHIYRSVRWWTAPTHTVVLGDLLGSQWIGDEEFERRANRFWDRVFAGAVPVPASITGSSGRVERLGVDAGWADRIIAVAGNHDIGYSGDIDESRIARFEKSFGRVNWEIRFELNNGSPTKQDSVFTKPQSPELRLIILNSMNLDEPTSQPVLQDQTRDFLKRSLDDIASQANAKAGTILLTHVPLHKKAGTCLDDPKIDLFAPEHGGGIREQNHLRPETSIQLLDDLPAQSIVLNGHDHNGCDVLHYRKNLSSASTTDDTDSDMEHWAVKKLWSARLQLGRYPQDSIREITVRSMMGDFSGNAGLLSAWFDNETQRWRFEYGSCRLGVQHYWWATHVLALVEVGLLFAGSVAILIERAFGRSTKQKTE